MEIMGLAIVVILVSLSMLFVVKWVALRKPKDYAYEYSSTELSSNVISTLLRTNSRECSKLSFSELFQDCADQKLVECNGGTMSSCDYLQSKVAGILDQMLKDYGYDYNFIVYLDTEGNDVITPITGTDGCPGERRSRRFIIPLSGRSLNIRLDICRQIN